MGAWKSKRSIHPGFISCIIKVKVFFLFLAFQECLPNKTTPSNIDETIYLPPEYESGIYMCQNFSEVSFDGFNFRRIQPTEGSNYAVVFALTALKEGYSNLLWKVVNRTRKVWDYDIVLLVYDEIEIKMREDLKKKAERYNFLKLKEVGLPFDKNKLSPRFLEYQDKNSNCCGAAEYIKLHALTLPYTKTVMLDLDITIRKHFDHLLLCHDDLDFTSGQRSPLNMAMISMKGNDSARFEDMILVLEKYSWIYTNEKWYTGNGLAPSKIDAPFNSKKNGAFFYGAEGPQGFLFFYFVVNPNKQNFRVNKISRCIYQMDMYKGKGCGPAFTENGFPIFVHKPGGLEFFPDFYQIIENEKQQCGEDFWFLHSGSSGFLQFYDSILRSSGNFTSQKFPKPLQHSLFNDPSNFVKSCGHRASKFIVVLREPVERCYHEVLSNATIESKVSSILDIHTSAFIERENGTMKWVQKAIPDRLFNHGEANCVYEGIYVAHLRRWFYFLSRENFLVLFRESLHSDLTKHALENFLSVKLDAAVFSRSVIFHTPTLPNFPQDLVMHMQKVFGPYNGMLQDMFAMEIPWLIDDEK